MIINGKSGAVQFSESKISKKCGVIRWENSPPFFFFIQWAESKLYNIGVFGWEHNSEWVYHEWQGYWKVGSEPSVGLSWVTGILKSRSEPSVLHLQHLKSGRSTTRPHHVDSSSGALVQRTIINQFSSFCSIHSCVCRHRPSMTYDVGELGICCLRVVVWVALIRFLFGMWHY